MKKLLLTTFIMLIALSAFAQINMEDSTVQVIGYWDKNEKQTYQISTEKYKYSNSDTTRTEKLLYKVDISIIDSTADSYTINWYYYDYQFNGQNEITKKLIELYKDMKVVIKTNEMGVFQDVLNWKELRTQINEGIKMIKNEYSMNTDFVKIIENIEKKFTTKESIINSSIAEIQQFYSFHGAKYKLGEDIETQMKAPNMYGKEPFDTYVNLWLDEINEEDNNFVLRMNQEIDSTQLTKATLDYLTQLSKSTKLNMSEIKSNMPTLKNETWVAMRMHGTGWPVYSVQTKEVTAEGITNVEETIIEIL